jgi:phosphatidylserine decarboxylase
MSVLGVYSTRSPVEGKILEIPQTDSFNPGMPNGVWLQTDQKDDVVVVMNRGRLHTAPRCYVRIGERVGQGQRCGFVHLGSLVDVYVPANTRINVKPGDRVQAGSTVVATLVRK